MPEDTPEMVTITIDGREQTVPAGELVIRAAENTGTYIPRFCWHPRMKPVGMCRMCLVEVETPRGRMLTTSCTMPVAEGMIVDTESDVARKAQEGILEFLLINHPLDCPVCDKGGECPLQDQTMAYGPGESRFVEEKRHYEKPLPISDLVLLDRERCILCARCTRFSDEISGDPLIEFVDRGNAAQVLTFPDEPFASYFSGNTVQICPVGALTAVPYRFRARPWDLEAVESVSMVDSFGSRVSVQTSQNRIVRINGVDNDATNQGWLSDKDRFIYEAAVSEHRLGSPLVKEGDGFREATWGEALDLVADRLGSVRGDQVAGLGGARSTNEEAFAFGKFLRTVVVTPHLDSQLGDGLAPRFLAGVVDRATIPDLERARAILLWAGDLKEELPVLYLRVRRAASELGAKLVVIHPRRTGLDDVAAHKITYRPGDGPAALKRLATGDDADSTAARAALEAGPIVAIVGRTGLAEDPRLAEAVAAFARSLPDAAVLPLARRGNVYGALDMGLTADLLPGRVSSEDDAGRSALEEVWGPLPEPAGRDAAAILEGLSDGSLDSLVLLGSDPVRDHTSPSLAMRALENAGFVVAFDQFLTDSSRLADVVLPVDGFGETEGTVTNLEGRVQKVNRIVPGPGLSRSAWSALDDLSRRMGGDLGAPSAEMLMKEIAAVAPAYEGITWDMLDWGPGREGVVVPGPDGTQPLQYVPADAGLGPAPDGQTLHLGRVLYDDGVLTRMSPALAQLTPAARAYLHPADAEDAGLAEGATLRVRTGESDAWLPLGLDVSLARGAVYIPANLALTATLDASLAVTIEPVEGGSA
ncbi:MAG: NADH-quinone oxidoreductase subunit NuoG [Acidimicrobiia bacterium]